MPPGFAVGLGKGSVLLALVVSGSVGPKWLRLGGLGRSMARRAHLGRAARHAPTLEETDWSQIVALYDQLLAVAPTPVVALNRAIAVGEVQGADAALALVDNLELHNYHLFHATRADLLTRLGRKSELPSQLVVDFRTGRT